MNCMVVFNSTLCVDKVVLILLSLFAHALLCHCSLPTTEHKSSDSSPTSSQQTNEKNVNTIIPPKDRSKPVLSLEQTDGYLNKNAELNPSLTSSAESSNNDAAQKDAFASSDLKLHSKISKRSQSLFPIGSKRKWANFNSWGKRSARSDDSATWGRRYVTEPEEKLYADVISKKKRWAKSGFNSWGKRNNIQEILNKWIQEASENRAADSENMNTLDKKWKSDNFNAWGKRNAPILKKWSKNSFDSWGKRSSDKAELSNSLESDISKKWAKSGFNSWGKRNDDDLQIDQDKRWTKSGFNSWGKRSIDEIQKEDDKKWSKSGFNSWGKRSDDALEKEEDKRWANKNFNSWGKRSNDDRQEEKRWDKSGFNSWGKRSDDALEKEEEKRWSKSGFDSWGKRSDDELQKEEDKRWANKNFNSWGKRSDDEKKWANSGFNSWGKRLFDNNDEILDKRWTKSGFQSWGKRTDDENPISTDSKRWSKNGFNSWGKREGENEGNKRWSKSGFNSWGKRTDDTDKRWASNNGFNSWGKRDTLEIKEPDNLDTDAVMSLDKKSVENEKRWSKDSFNSWGKRSAYNTKPQFKKWASEGFNAWGKRNYPSSSELGPSDVRGESVASGNKRNKRELQNTEPLEQSPVNSRNHLRKRRWNNQLHVWGKRTNFPFFGGPKRGWKANEMKVWGKRSSTWPKTDDISQNDQLNLLLYKQFMASLK